MSEAVLKVGALARRTGLSVRALHHYDQIGLLSPSRRTSSGHRLYGIDEVRRLQQIVSLRQLGLSLEDIRRFLTRADVPLGGILEMHVARIREEIRRQQMLCDLLERLRSRLDETEDVSLQEITRTIEATMNFEKYYSPDQLDYLRKRSTEVGVERMQEAQRDWQELFAAYAKAMAQGLDPASEEVQSLARRSAALIEEFTGGDEGIRESLAAMYRAEGAENVLQHQDVQMEPGVWQYMGRASEALRKSEAEGG
ncbi:MAG: MerR family transcriptional regulator [Gemmatimonadota bacterium]|jgi:DNA-binding transcriptional MerR regulator